MYPLDGVNSRIVVYPVIVAAPRTVLGCARSIEWSTPMARKRKLEETVNLRLRLPEALRQALTAAAEKSERSLNSEILWRLGRTFGPEWQEFVTGMEDRERREQELRERVLQDPKMRKTLDELIARHIPSLKGER
jgi:hypothetical protein